MLALRDLLKAKLNHFLLLKISRGGKKKKKDLCFPCHKALENKMTESIESFALQM